MAESRPPRALVTTSTFPRWRDDSTARFVQDLAEIATPEWSVTVLAPHHPGARTAETLGTLDVRRFSYFFPRSLERLCYGGGILPNARASRLAAAQLGPLLFAELAATRARLRAETFDLVHAHFLVPQGWVAARLLRTSALPLIVSVHGSDLFALGGPIARRVQRAVVARADIVTVNSDATARELRARAPGASSKIVTLPMGHDPAIFNLGSPGGERRPQILYVGRLSKQKGADVLIDALPRVLARVPAATLAIVGAGPAEASLRAQAAALGVDHRVEQRGALPRSAIAELYRSSAVAVIPSREGAGGAEGQSLVAVEAMACECPVVATRSGGLTFLVGASERGILVSPDDPRALADAIVATLADPDGARRRARAASEYVRARFTWQSIKPRLLEVYAEATARRSARC